MVENQNIIYSTKEHWITLIKPLIFIIIGLTGLITIMLFPKISIYHIFSYLKLILLFKGIMKVLNYNKTSVIISNLSIICHKGFLNKTTVEIPIEKFEGIILNQSFIGKILNFGRLTITTGGFYDSYLIPNPTKFFLTLSNQKSIN